MVLIVSKCLQGCHIRGCFVGYAVHKLIRGSLFGPSAECRRVLVWLPNACGAAVRGRKYDFHLLHLPGSKHVFRLLIPMYSVN